MLRNIITLFGIAVVTIVASLVLSAKAHADPFAEVSLSVRQASSAMKDASVKIDGKDYSYHVMRLYDVNVTKNPYASLRIGYAWHTSDTTRLSLSIGHESSIATSDDRGINDFKLTLRWGHE